MESRKRSVSLQGCVTCRARKLKCDETRPSCSRCIKSNLPCEGYEAKLRWTFYNPNRRSTRYHTLPRDRGEEHGRRLLYTERQRLAMSRQVAASVLISGPHASDLASLSECELSYDNEDSNSSQCCFQIFRLRQPSQSSDVSACSIRPTDEENISCTTVSPEGHSMATVPTTQASSIGVNHGEVWDDLFSRVDDSSRHSDSSQDVQSPTLSNSPIRLPTLSLASSEQDNYPLPINTHFLIDHYRNNMGNWFSPLHSSKHPWAVLHLPVALMTLSELRIWGKAKHARVAILHSLLSLSAFTLTTDDETGHWREVALQNQAIANTKMKGSLASEFDGPGKAKYKDMLLAFLALTSISVVSGQHKDARAYLLDAERLICARGLRKRPTSRKKQLLHHYYLFLRVIEESTHIYANTRSVDVNHEHDASRASLLFPSIQTHSRWHHHALNALSGTSFESSLLSHDQSKPSVLMEIYGIPLSLFSLISRATHLADEKAACQGNVANTRLASQLKNLENDICAWNFYTAPSSDIDSHRLSSETFSTNARMLQHIVQAMHGGLVLYFYRRCHHLNAMLLQSHVDQILQHLQAVEEERVMLQLYNTSLIWPGFFAAAEAQGEGRRREALAWLRGNAERSGWGSFASAADLVEELWRRQEQEEEGGLTWVELLRGRGTVLFLS